MKEQNKYWEKKNIWNLSAFLADKFLQVCPYGKKHLEHLVLNCKKDILLITFFSITVLLIWNGLFDYDSVIYLFASIFLTVYLVIMEVANHWLQERENKVYRDLLMYFSRVKHRYLVCKHITNAVIDAADGMSYEIQRLADEMFQVLSESDRKEKVRDYIMNHRTNRYLKLFLIQAFEVSEKGDMFFEENIEFLRLELMEEIYRRERQTHEFAGYVFVSVTPFYMMPILKYWGMEFAPELNFFYSGTGILLEMLTFVVTIIIYGMILRAKEIVLFSNNKSKKIWNGECLYNNGMFSYVVCRLEKMEGEISQAIRRWILLAGETKSYGKICLQMLMLAVSSFLLLIAFCAGLHNRERKAIMESVGAIETIAPIYSAEKQDILANHILSVTKQCSKKVEVTQEEIQMLLQDKIRLKNKNIEQAAIQEVVNKLEKYHKAKISIGEIAACLLGSLLMGCLPLGKLYYQVHTLWTGAVNEVRQFQSIILMDRRLYGITVVDLLEDMEIFSQCFRSCLRRCINTYGAGPDAALMQLKKEGSYIHESFEELADAFLSVDEVGIELAFAEVENNRRLLEKMTQLEAEINIERKKDSTDVLAKIPMVLTVGAYFILPLFMFSLQGVSDVFHFLEEMKF